MMLFLVMLSASFSSARPKWSLIEVEDNVGVDNNEDCLRTRTRLKETPRLTLTTTMHYGIKAMGAMTLRISELYL